MRYKIGIGYDIHRLVKNRKLILGGVEIPYNKGLIGHSDADVLLHALSDALLGACGEQDIGQLFPDKDPVYKDISSVFLLKQVVKKLKIIGFVVSNIDAVIIAQEPVLAGFKDKMRLNISRILKIKLRDVNIKAKTNEGLDAIGKKNAIGVQAVALIMQKGKKK